MYSIIDVDDGRILFKLPSCTKIFTSGGKLVEFNTKGMAHLPKGSMVSVCKVLHFQKSSIRMTKDIQALHHNSNISEFSLSCDNLVAREKEILLSSLEVIENL